MIEIDGVDYLTAQEVCELLGIKPATLYAYVSRGVLSSYRQRVGRSRLYRADEVQALRHVQLDAAAAGQQPEQQPGDDHDLPAAEEWMSEL